MKIQIILQTLYVGFITLVASDESLRTRSYSCPASSAIGPIFSAQNAIMNTLKMKCTNEPTFSEIPDMGRPLYGNTKFNKFTI